MEPVIFQRAGNLLQRVYDSQNDKVVDKTSDKYGEEGDEHAQKRRVHDGRRQDGRVKNNKI